MLPSLVKSVGLIIYMWLNLLDECLNTRYIGLRVLPFINGFDQNGHDQREFIFHNAMMMIILFVMKIVEWGSAHHR